ncbi:MAG: recombinase family protein [Methanomassiliicoccaceae archaeon]|jgi:DNA invertase Pin-like site-specific DNA recombinase|nr:recombinase family protein [Methanomassiliicoccaceae archaeon]
MNDAAVKRVAVYARVSTEDQATEGYSLGAQLDMLHAYVECQDSWTVQDEYIDDGYSGRNDKRPEYKRMMSAIDKWDAVLVVKMDRIHRNSRNFMAMMDFLTKHKKEFVSSADSLDTSTAFGRFFIDILQRIAQLESEQIGERTYTGMREKAESSKGIMGSSPPFGYSAENGELMTNEEEMVTVKEIFRRYLKGMTMDEICYHLNRNGMLTRRSNAWNKFNLRNILHNPVYAGYMRWEELRIPHSAERPVSEKEFCEVQRIIASRTKYSKKEYGLFAKNNEAVPEGQQ